MAEMDNQINQTPCVHEINQSADSADLFSCQKCGKLWGNQEIASDYTKAVADLATERNEAATLTTQLNEMREALRELCEATKDARLLYVYGVVQMPTDYEDSRANQTRCEGEAKLMFSKIDFAQTKAKALLDKSGED